MTEKIKNYVIPQKRDLISVPIVLVSCVTSVEDIPDEEVLFDVPPLVFICFECDNSLYCTYSGGSSLQGSANNDPVLNSSVVDKNIHSYLYSAQPSAGSFSYTSMELECTVYKYIKKGKLFVEKILVDSDVKGCFVDKTWLSLMACIQSPLPNHFRCSLLMAVRTSQRVSYIGYILLLGLIGTIKVFELTSCIYSKTPLCSDTTGSTVIILRLIGR